MITPATTTSSSHGLRGIVRAIVIDLAGPEARFDDGHDLFASGLVRSMSLLELINQLEDRFAIRVVRRDVGAGRLRSVDAIVELVAARQGGRS